MKKSSPQGSIRGCTVDTGDDAFCLKTTSALPCRNVTVSDCHLSSHWGTIKCGTESLGDMEKIRVSDCRIHKAQGGGIKVLGMDGANIRMERPDMAVFVQLGRRLRRYPPGDPQRAPDARPAIRLHDAGSPALP